MTAEGIRIRKLEEGDIDAAKELVAQYVRWINVSLSFQHIDEELSSFPRTYREPEGSFFVALDGGAVIGCIGMKKIGPGVCEMKRLFVKDGYKGRKVGEGLAAALIDEARRKGYRAMRLDTLRTMEAALGLYRKLGFHEIGQYVENPIPGAVFMERAL